MRCFLKLTGCFCLSLRVCNFIISCVFLVLSAAFLLRFAITGFKTTLLYYGLYAFLLLLMLTSSLALYGVYKKNPSFLVPSLLLSKVILLLTFSEIVVLVIFEFALDRKAPAHTDAFGKNQLLQTVIAFLITWFVTSVKHSYYQELGEEQKSRTV